MINAMMYNNAEEANNDSLPAKWRSNLKNEAAQQLGNHDAPLTATIAAICTRMRMSQRFGVLFEAARVMAKHGR